MSKGQQPTLDEFVRDRVAEWERVLEDTGALYGRTQDTSHEHAPADAGQCQTCGREIEPAVQRTIGDEYGRVPVCENCAQNYYGQTFTTTTSAVVAYRDGRFGTVEEGSR